MTEESEVKVKQWMIKIFVAILTTSIGGIFWLAKLDHRISGIPKLEKDVTIALQVLADHGSEFETLRGTNVEIWAALNRIELELKQRTEDRWHKRDAMREWDFHRRREHSDIEEYERVSP